MTSPRVVELEAVLRPTAALQAMRLESSPGKVEGMDLLKAVTGGEVSLRIVAAPGIAGKWLGAVVEQWPNGHTDILGACHADSPEQAALTIMPHYQRICAARKG